MLVQGLGQQHQSQRKAEMDAALGHIIAQAVETGKDVERRHQDRHKKSKSNKLV